MCFYFKTIYNKILTKLKKNIKDIIVSCWSALLLTYDDVMSFRLLSIHLNIFFLYRKKSQFEKIIISIYVYSKNYISQFRKNIIKFFQQNKNLK